MQDMFKDENMKEFNNPLDWWRNNENQFPLIAKMAKRYLAIPATSAPSERVWSLSAFVINAKRARLDSEVVSKMMFIEENVNY